MKKKNTVQVGNYPKVEVGNEFCNRAISDNYRDYEFWLMPSQFIGAFAYWVAALSPKGIFVVNQALNKFYYRIVNPAFENLEVPQKFTLGQLEELINEERFKKIPEILVLNEGQIFKDDFIDLGALAREVLYTIAREQITQPL